MPPTIATEKPTVQDPIVSYAAEIGWEIVSQEEQLSMRKGESGTMFYRVLEEKLLELNEGLINRENVEDIIRRLEAVRNNIEGNAEILSWIRGEQAIYDETEKRRRNVTVVDFNHPERNLFQVTAEWQYSNGKETNRADVMFLINGVPVTIVETKSARKTDGMEEALVQIRRYHQETPEMLTAPQVFNITHIVDFSMALHGISIGKTSSTGKTKEMEILSRR